MKPYYQDAAGVVLYHGDCREVLPALALRDIHLVLTDPPYLTGNAEIEHNHSHLAPRNMATITVGSPWGYSLDFLEMCGTPAHYIIFANYLMLGDVCGRLHKVSCVFTWRKSNAPNMSRPVPRLDCEFIVWKRSPQATCGRMKEFRSMVLDVPMPQAGCLKSERFLEADSRKAAHPCQKPLAVVAPFVARLCDPGDLILDPFCGTGTTLRAAKDNGCRAIGIEIDERYCEMTARRLEQGVLAFTD